MKCLIFAAIALFIAPCSRAQDDAYFARGANPGDRIIVSTEGRYWYDMTKQPIRIAVINNPQYRWIVSLLNKGKWIDANTKMVLTTTHAQSIAIVQQGHADVAIIAAGENSKIPLVKVADIRALYPDINRITGGK